MKSLRCSLIVVSLIGVAAPSGTLASGKPECAVTKPPKPPFVPPKPYSAFHGEREFLYGTPALWTIVNTHWHLHIGGKLPFFRQGFEYRTDRRPQLTVVARRLDDEAPLVWSSLPGSGYMEGEGLEGMFMNTGMNIPSSGCWEIAAHYITDPPASIQTLSYTVSVSN
jgi:hypothetical protein